MRVNHSPEEVKAIVTREFSKFGVSKTPAESLEETIRVERGMSVARCYRAAGLMAMWLIPAGIVQFYDGEGRMLLTIRLWQERSSCYQAA